MSNLTTISENENKMISTVFSSKVSTAYSNTELYTVEDCKEQYLKADEIASIAKNAIKDKLQGFALLKARKILMPTYWDSDVKSLSGEDRISAKKELKNYQSFLSSIKCSEAQSSYLLDFAGYKEKGGEIETASHYREVKKVSSTKSVEEIDGLYNEAGGSDLTTAKEVKEEVQSKSIWVQALFEKEVAKEPKTTYSEMAFGGRLTELMPTPDADEWKTFYRKVALCIHPDQGGNADQSAILNQLDEMYQFMFSHLKEREEVRQWNVDYKIWKEDKGYKGDFVKENQI